MELQSTACAASPQSMGAAVEQVLIGGNLKPLTQEQRIAYYHRVCESLGLNPLTRPFEYLELQGKLTLYARKDCTEQLRNSRKISVTIVSREVVEGVYVVTARASEPTGRCDESIGAVPIEGQKGEGRANAMMKAETKAKRRVTLSFCGLGMLDETEVVTIPGAVAVTESEIVPTDPDPAEKAEKEEAEVLAKRQNAALTKLLEVLKGKGISGGKQVLPWLTAQVKRTITRLSDLTPEEYAGTMEAAEKLTKKGK